MSSLEIGSYANILSFLLLSFYIIKHRKALVKNLTKNLSISILALPPILKLFVIKKIPVAVASLTSFMTPIVSMILSFILLKDFERKNFDKYVKNIASFFAVILFMMSYEGDGFKIQAKYYSIIGLYLFLKASCFLIVKNKSSNKIETIIYIKFFFVLYSVLIFQFSEYTGQSFNFNYHNLFIPEIIILGVVTILVYLSLIMSFRSESVSSLQYLKHSQVVISIVLGYLFLGESINKEQAICVALILTISMFDNEQVKKIHSKFKRNN